MAKKEKFFVKPKKVWTKKFSKEEIREIWDCFIEASPFSKEEWKGKSLLEAFDETRQFIHPETDKYDDTVGVQPKQMVLLRKELTNEEICHLFKVLNSQVGSRYISTSSEWSNVALRFLEDGFINWERIIYNVLEDMKNSSFFYVVGSLLWKSSSLINFKASKEVIELIGREPSTISDIEEVLKLTSPELQKGSEVKIEHTDIKKVLGKRKDLWKKIKGFVPQSKHILLSNPNNFDKRLLPKIEQIFGSKQIAKLPEEEQFWVRFLINSLGLNLLDLDSKFVKNQLKNLYKDSSLVTKISNEVDLKEGLLKKLPISSLSQAIEIVSILNEFPYIREQIKRKDKVSKNDMEILSFIERVVSATQDQRRKEFLIKMDWNFWFSLHRYRVLDPNDIFRLGDLYENRAKSSTIPHIKGKEGEYTYEILKKDNPLGLILGYATDCCQVIGNQGESCLRRGYDRENSSFFAVMKKNRVYAQSWVWEKVTSDGKRIFCFDSIEVLGKNLEASKDILNAYKEVSKKLIEEGYDLVIAGADGNTMPKGMDILGEYEDSSFIEDFNLKTPFPGTYSDAENEIYIIEGEI